jgi:hypothetical protein
VLFRFRPFRFADEVSSYGRGQGLLLRGGVDGGFAIAVLSYVRIGVFRRQDACDVNDSVQRLCPRQGQGGEEDEDQPPRGMHVSPIRW